MNLTTEWFANCTNLSRLSGDISGRRHWTKATGTTGQPRIGIGSGKNNIMALREWCHEKPTDMVEERGDIGKRRRGGWTMAGGNNGI